MAMKYRNWYGFHIAIAQAVLLKGKSFNQMASFNSDCEPISQGFKFRKVNSRL